MRGEIVGAVSPLPFASRFQNRLSRDMHGKFTVLPANQDTGRSIFQALGLMPLTFMLAIEPSTSFSCFSGTFKPSRIA